MRIWILPVNSNFEQYSTLYGVSVEPLDTVHDIRKKAQAEEPLLATFNTRVRFWKPVGKAKISDELLELLKNDRSKVCEIEANVVLDNIGLSDDDMLAMQVQGTSRISTAPEAFSDNLVDEGILKIPVIDTHLRASPVSAAPSEYQERQGELKEYTRMFKPL
jgi:hypothetical protein